MFIKPCADVGNGYMSLFDTSESTANNAGFSFSYFDSGRQAGSLQMQISDNTGNNRIIAATPIGLIAPGTWYHVVVVGQGVGQPLKFYVTPVTSSTVHAYVTSQTISGPDGNYATDAIHDLSIGAQSHTGLAAYNGQFVDPAIFDRALTDAEVQQLFDYTKKS
jgi:hypothetical protein